MRKGALLCFRLIIAAIICTILGCSGSTNEREIPLPEGEKIGKIWDLAFDGTDFWGVRTVPEQRKEIIRFTQSGNIISTFTPKENFSGLTYDGTKLWTADIFGWESGKFFGRNDSLCPPARLSEAGIYCD